MKGQTLFIRPIESADTEAVINFLQQHGGGSADTQTGILAKLVGDLAAVLTFRAGDRNIEVQQLIVREDLRRKRIGHFMLDELERVAASTGREFLLAPKNTDTDPFLQKAGFVEEGDSMVRRVIRAEG